MKKDYIKPEVHINNFELETSLLQASSEQGNINPEEGDPDDFSSKDRNNTGDSSWGDIW